ncbi:MAG: hypothetical protein IKZ87_01855 [Actinomycetaceae bacterium]|nr:hypothetical protein [Actinomycetaceae bacterium]
MIKKGISGLGIGVVTGLFGVASHAGFVDMAILGLFFALALVAAGAWFTIEWFDTLGWLAYLLACVGVTLFLLLIPHTPDVLVAPQKWASQAYIVLVPIVAALPAFFVTRAEKATEK